jgi:peptide/nickel transport system permease protein
MALQIQESVSINPTNPTRREPVSGLREESAFRRGAYTLTRSKNATAGAVIIVVLLVLLVIGPTVAPYDPTVQDLMAKNQGPSPEHWLGTDNLGRDIFSRILHGARISLSLSLGAVGLALLIGIPVGLISGYVGGLLDNLIVSLVDILLTLPTYLLAIFIVAITGPSLVNIMLAVGIATIPTIIRIVRSDTLSMKNWEVTTAARCVGARPPRILFRHILPNIVSAVAIVATIQLGGAILVEASLSFLGLGLSPPTPSWGLMINEGLRFLSTNPRIALIPGFAIMITVLGFNLFGDGLRDALDPRLRGRRDG